MKKQQELVNKAILESMEQKVLYEQLLRQNNALLEKQSSLQDQISIVQSKAYGFDTAKKFDLYKGNQNRQHNINAYGQHDHNDPLRNKLDTQAENQQGYNFWEKENKIGHSTRLDDLGKEKDLWVNQQDKNVHKLVNDIDRTKGNNYVGGNYGTYGGTNVNKSVNVNPNSMGKYSNMILNNNPKENQLNNSYNKGKDNTINNTYARKY